MHEDKEEMDKNLQRLKEVTDSPLDSWQVVFPARAAHTLGDNIA